MAITDQRLFVRSMTQDDILRVMDIERQSFPAAWPQHLYERELAENRLARYLVAERVAQDGDSAEVIGFVGLWFMVNESHVVTIAVDPQLRRRGFGELLLLAAIDLSLANNLDVMTLEVRVSNTAAQELYLKYGFHQTGLRRRYYSDNNEDALIMTTEAMDTSAYQERLAGLRRRFEERYGPFLSAF